MILQTQMPPSLSFFFFLFSHGQRHDASVVCFGIIFRRIFIALERSLSVLSKKSAGCRMLLASAVKRRRLNGKQPSPPAYTSEAADGQHAVASDLILPVEPSLHPTEGHLGEDFGPDDLFPCADSADGPSSLDNGPEDPLQPSRWSFLGRGKTVQSLVAAIAKEKTDAELHAFTVGELLKEVFHRGGGKVTMAELEEARDDFISASMAIVPRELSRRLVSAVANPAKEQGNKKKQESDPKKLGGPPLQGDPVDIDCTTVQKNLLVNSEWPECCFCTRASGDSQPGIAKLCGSRVSCQCLSNAHGSFQGASPRWRHALPHRDCLFGAFSVDWVEESLAEPW